MPKHHSTSPDPRGGFNQNRAFASRPNRTDDYPQPPSTPRPIGSSRESWAEHLKKKKSDG